MTRRLCLPPPKRDTVFLNIPYEPSYEKLFVAAIATLVSLGYTPRCTLEIAEKGEGRLHRIQEVLSSCQHSIHFLCRVGTPVRFNMPFELGLAYSFSRYSNQHALFLFERVRYRLLRTLSDVQGMDPYIHNGTMNGIIECVLDAFVTNENSPDPCEVRSFSKELWRFACDLQHRARRDSLFNRTLFGLLITGGAKMAADRELIQH